MITGTYTTAARAWLINDGESREAVLATPGADIWAEVARRYPGGKPMFVLDHDRMTYAELIASR
jgi:hypothetical protein